MKKYTRRDFVKLSAVGAVAGALSGGKAYAYELPSGGKQKFTEKIAAEFADELATSLFPEVGVRAGCVIPMLSVANGLIGYSVSYFSGSGDPHGYVVFDINSPSLVSEFSFDYGMLDPYAQISSIDFKSESSASSSQGSTRFLVQIAPFEYGVLRDNGDVVLSGGIAHETAMPIDVLRDAWGDVLIDVMLDLSNYHFGVREFVHGSWTVYPDERVYKECGRFACAVSSMCVCAGFYAGVQFSNTGVPLKTAYDRLWALSNTEVYGQSNSGHDLGKTTNSAIGPAMCQYLKEDWGLSVSSNLLSDPVSFNSFSSCIERGDIGIFAGSLSSDLGHAMPVVGYAIMLDKKANKTYNTLIVNDTWNTGVRYLIFDYDYYTKVGILFRR